MYIDINEGKIWLENLCEPYPIVIVREQDKDQQRHVMPEHITPEEAHQIAVIMYPMDEERTAEYNEYLNEKAASAGLYY